MASEEFHRHGSQPRASFLPSSAPGTGQSEAKTCAVSQQMERGLWSDRLLRVGMAVGSGMMPGAQKCNTSLGGVNDFVGVFDHIATKSQYLLLGSKARRSRKGFSSRGGWDCHVVTWEKFWNANRQGTIIRCFVSVWPRRTQGLLFE